MYRIIVCPYIQIVHFLHANIPVLCARILQATTLKKTPDRLLEVQIMLEVSHMFPFVTGGGKCLGSLAKGQFCLPHYKSWILCDVE